MPAGNEIPRPWQDLPPGTFNALAPLLPSIADEMIETIRREVPDYSRPLTGTFGATVRLGVEQALEKFAELVSSPGATRAAARDVYVQLGRGELVAGRSIGTLLAAYRVGARVAWRRLAAAGLEAGLPQKTLNQLAEAIFAYIDELSAESAEGYALAQAELAGEVDRRRAELVAALTSGGADARALATAAGEAEWRLPANLAIVLWNPVEGDRAVVPPAGSIVATLGQAAGTPVTCAVMPDPDGPGRREQLFEALDGTVSGVGTAVEPLAAAHSLRHARAALKLAAERGGGPVFAAEACADLIARADPELAELACERLLAPLAGETPASRDRLQATLLAWLRHNGNVPAAAADLHVHPQTLRYRLARLRELLGETLDDPDRRFTIEAGLRARANAPASVSA